MKQLPVGSVDGTVKKVMKVRALMYDPGRICFAEVAVNRLNEDTDRRKHFAWLLKLSLLILTFSLSVLTPSILLSFSVLTPAVLTL